MVAVGAALGDRPRRPHRVQHPVALVAAQAVLVRLAGAVSGVLRIEKSGERG